MKPFTWMFHRQSPFDGHTAGGVDTNLCCHGSYVCDVEMSRDEVIRSEKPDRWSGERLELFDNKIACDQFGLMTEDDRPSGKIGLLPTGFGVVFRSADARYGGISSRRSGVGAFGCSVRSFASFGETSSSGLKQPQRNSRIEKGNYQYSPISDGGPLIPFVLGLAGR